MRRLGIFAVGLVCVLLAVGCDDGDKAATTSPPAQSHQLPAVVAEKRDAIVSAAKQMDYARLRRLLDPATFSYSFGESGDPIGYWRRLEGEGEVPILGDYLPVVLGSPFARQKDVYVWPAAFAKKPASWTAADRRSMRNFYTAKEIRAFEQAGGYFGWRAGIRKDGKWLFFVAGD